MARQIPSVARHQEEPKIPWGFASKRYDPETGFAYFGKSNFCPEMGRFITQDCIYKHF